VTLIVLLILAAVSLSAVFSDKGVFSKAESAGEKYNEAKAREVLEIVLMTDGQMEKHTNPKYNQDEFLDELIKSEIEGADVKGDIAIVGGYAYELDRSVPKIGRYLGKAENLVFPTVNATVQLASDKKNATVTINASENKNGINKIEIWLLGEKIKEYIYDPAKLDIIEQYTATQNGKYIIKAYGDLMANVTVEVTGIMPGIEFEPNGNTTWEKQHSTKIKVTETEEKIKNMKYQWTNSVTEPADNTFTENCKDGDTITKNNVTGTYYLWILLETESGATAKRRSERFNFDNEGPTITSFTATKYSQDSIILDVTTQDMKSGTVKIEFYIDEETEARKTEIFEKTTESITKNIEITGLTMGEHTCKVIVYDILNNHNTNTIIGSTMQYALEIYNYSTTTVYEAGEWTVFKTNQTDNLSASSNGTFWYAPMSSSGPYEMEFDYYNRRWDYFTWYGYGGGSRDLYDAFDNSTARNKYVYKINGLTLYRYVKTGTISGTNKYTYKIESNTAGPVNKNIKNTSKNIFVYSSNQTAYPKDGVANSTYYYYIGIK